MTTKSKQAGEQAWQNERSRTAWEWFFARIEEMKAKPRRGTARQLELSQ